MPPDGGYSILQITILSAGLIACCLVICGCYYSFVKKSGKASLIFSEVGLLAALATMGLSWIAYLQDKAVVQEAIARAGITIESEMAMTAMASCAGNVTLGLWLIILPLGLGVILMVRGLVVLPVEGDQAGSRFSLAVVAIGLTAGVGLSLVAFADYLRFNDFFSVLFLLS